MAGDLAQKHEMDLVVFAMALAFSGSQQPLPFRSSKRLSITVAQATLEALVERSVQEGRSISNLASYLLESSLAQGSR